MTTLTVSPSMSKPQMIRDIEAKLATMGDHDAQLRILSKAQGMAVMLKDDWALDVYAIIKRRIIRKGQNTK